jgi:hypothetical protein
MNSYTQNPITALIQTRQTRTVTDLIQLSSDDLKALLRGDYLQAEQAHVIKLITTLVSLAGKRDGAGLLYEATFEEKPLTIRLTAKGLLTVAIKDQIVCSNNPPGEEMILPGRWLAFIKAQLDAWEGNEAAKQKQAQAEAEANAQRKELIDHQEMILTLMEDV